MGDPRRMKAKYSGPSHPWDKTRIEEESAIAREYGLKNRKELWKMRSILKGFTDQAKRLIAITGKQSDREKQQLLKKLHKLGLTETEQAKLDDILNLKVSNILERRLQTQVVRKGFAKSMKQARQFLNHRHILIGDRKVTQPSYLLTKEEEKLLKIAENSSLVVEEHSEKAVKS